MSASASSSSQLYSSFQDCLLTLSASSLLLSLMGLLGLMLL